jgi:hypothetical protein
MQTDNRRAELMDRIQRAREEEHAHPGLTINQIILAQYRAEGKGQIFKTISGWNQSGYVVERGQKGLPLWSQPRKRKPDENGKARRDWHAVIYVFSEKQVFSRMNQTPRPRPEPEPTPEQAPAPAPAQPEQAAPSARIINFSHSMGENAPF